MPRGVERRRSRWLNYIVLATSLAVTVAVLEVAARRVLPLEPYEIVSDEADGEPIGLEHPTRGNSLRAGFKGHFVHPDFNAERVTINSFGFRDREPPVDKLPNALHVTVLGDSVAFGTGVEASETFSELAESRLQRSLEVPVEVFNTGVAGYGALHQLVVLREEYARQEPDIAIVAFYTGNDLQDVYGFYQGRGAVVDLLQRFSVATTRSERHVGKNVVEIDGQSRKVISAHPHSEIRYPLQAGWIRPGASLRFGVALRPDSWGKSGADGVRFEVLAETDDQTEVLFDEHVDPTRELGLRGWNDRQVDLSGVSSADALIFRTTSGPAGSLEYDWAVWVEPHIFFAGAVDVAGDEEMPSRLVSKPVFKDYWQRVLAAKQKSRGRAEWEKRSSLFRLVAGRFDSLIVRWGLKPPKAVFSYYMISAFERQLSEHVRTALDQTMNALREMQSFMASRGGRVVLLLLPAKFQTEPETVNRFVQTAGLDPHQIDVDQPHRMLLDFCDRSGITGVDLLPELRRRSVAGEQVFFREGHPNRLGHRVIAERLATTIENLPLVLLGPGRAAQAEGER